LCPLCLQREFLADGTEAPRAPAPKSGDFIGDYELIGEIARGGMGIVYRARQRALDRWVALKLIDARHESAPEFVMRFETEARAAASLEHPNVVPIYEVGEHEGRHYFTMRLIEGGSLAGRLANRRHPISEREAAGLLAKISRAVHHAHQRGVLHRDLKPSNILLDAQGEPHLTDFGLARLLEAESFVTKSDAAVGTPAYMSPEQAAGGARNLTTASDIFSLGAILYEMLSGRPPFLGDTPLETMRKVVEEEPPPPSAAHGRELGRSEIRNPKSEKNPKPEVPGKSSPRSKGGVGPLSGFGFRASDLDIICLKCLAKEPKARYPTALALAEDLERWLSGETILARPSGTTERVWRWARRNRGKAALVATVLALSVVVLIGSTTAAVRIQRARNEARGQLARMLVAEGNRQMESDNSLRSLPAFVAAMRVEPGAPARALHRLRLGLVLQDAPEVTAMQFVDAVINDLAVSPDAQSVLVGAADGSVWLWRPTQDSALVLRGPQAETLNRFGTNAVYLVTPMGKGPLRERFVPEIDTVTLSPDGQLAAAAGWEGIARVWETSTGRLLTEGPRHEHFITRVAFSPDGNRLVTVSADDTARVWSSRSGEAICPPLRHEDDVLCAAFSPDGQMLATADAAGEIRTWRLPTGRLLASARRHQGAVTSLTFDRSGRLRSGGQDTRSMVWDATGTLTVLQEVQLAPGGRSSAIDPEGRFIVTTGGATPPSLWDQKTGALMIEMRGYGKHASFNHDASRIARASAFQNAARVWDTASGEPVTPPLPHGNRVIRAVLDHTGQILFTADADGVVRRWRLGASAQAEGVRDGEKAGGRAFPDHDASRWLVETDGSWRFWDSRSDLWASTAITFSNGVGLAVFCRDGRRIAIVNAAGTQWGLFSVPDGKAISPAHSVEGHIQRFAFEPEGALAAVVLRERPERVEVQAVADGRAAFAPLVVSNAVTHLEFGSRCQRLVVAFGHTALLVDTASGRAVATLVQPGTIEAASFSRDGRRLLTACTSAGLEPLFARVWNPQDGQPVSPPLRHFDGVAAASFDGRGERVATGGEDALARVWDAVTGRALSPPLRTGSGEFLYNPVISPDGSLVTATQRFRVRQTRYQGLLLWEVATGQRVGMVRRMDYSVSNLVWLPDSRQVAGLNPQSGVWRWPLPETRLDLDQLETLSTVLTAHRVDPAGSLVPDEPAKVKAAWEKWRSGATSRRE
jgi:serine/threonine protein kinase/WD40 repeat protein